MAPVNGGQSKRLSGDNRAIEGLAWMPDGREVVYASRAPEDLKNFGESMHREGRRNRSPSVAKIAESIVTDFGWWQPVNDGIYVVQRAATASRVKEQIQASFATSKTAKLKQGCAEGCIGRHV